MGGAKAVALGGCYVIHGRGFTVNEYHPYYGNSVQSFPFSLDLVHPLVLHLHYDRIVSRPHVVATVQR